MLLYERYMYIFHTADQQPNETVDQYVIIRLRQLAEKCKFTQLETEMIRDRLVLGTKDKATRARLFREKECDMKRAIESPRISELTQEQLKKIDVPLDTVSYVKKHRSSEHRKSKDQSSNGRKQHNKNKTKHKDDKQSHKVQTCKYCGASHERNGDKCPAYGKKMLTVWEDKSLPVRMQTEETQSNTRGFFRY